MFDKNAKVEAVLSALEKLESGKFCEGNLSSKEESEKVIAYRAKLDLLEVLTFYENKQPLNDVGKVAARAGATHDSHSNEEREAMNKVAYFLSKYEHQELFDDDLNQGESIKKAAQSLGVKWTTLKNKRDQYDPYLSSKRVGWHSSDHLSGDMERVMTLYNSMSKQEISIEVHRLLKLKQ